MKFIYFFPSFAASLHHRAGLTSLLDVTTALTWYVQPQLEQITVECSKMSLVRSRILALKHRRVLHLKETDTSTISIGGSDTVVLAACLVGRCACIAGFSTPLIVSPPQ